MADKQRGKAPRGRPRRQRRTAEKARQAILDAAEKRLAELGPDGIRLQQIADDVGVSHPAILHHFESREQLLGEVVRRALASLEADVITAISATSLDAGPPALAVIERAHRVLVEKGHARVLAWLALSARRPEPGRGVRAVAEVAHARRRQLEPDAEFEDTLFRVVLTGLAMIGEAVAGPLLRTAAGLGGDVDAPRRFREWLSTLVTTEIPRR